MKTNTCIFRFYEFSKKDKLSEAALDRRIKSRNEKKKKILKPDTFVPLPSANSCESASEGHSVVAEG
jgi:hypothetical protein